MIMQRVPRIFKKDERHPEAEDHVEQNVVAISQPRPAFGLSGLPCHFRSMLAAVPYSFPSC